MYQKGTRSKPHKGNTCGTDVTNIIPSFHAASAAKYLDPNFVGKICTATTTPNPTATPIAGSTSTPIPTSGPTTPPASCKTTSASWQTIPMTAQSGTYSVEFDATPGAANIDTVMGLSPSAATGYSGMAAIVRFAPTGVIDARNGSAYQAATSISYTAGTTYHFKMVINSSAHTYSAYVTPSGGSEITIGSNYAFRTEQASASSVPIFNIYSAVGSASVCGLISYSGSTPPTVTSIPNPTATPGGSCSLKSQGDANCDTIFDLLDFEIWRKEKTKALNTTTTDFNADNVVDSADFEIWRKAYFKAKGIT